MRGRVMVAALAAVGMSIHPASMAPVDAGVDDSAESAEIVSVADASIPSQAPGDRPQISRDGRFVTFDSTAQDLVSGVNSRERRVYRRDLSTGVIEMVSVGDDGRIADEWSSYSYPSSDGNLIAFTSDATYLTVPGARNRAIFLRDMNAGNTEMVSVSSNQVRSDGPCARPMTSGSGRFVVFNCRATSLSHHGGNGKEQVYLRDRSTQSLELVSVNHDGHVGNGVSYRGMVSDDGRYVAFVSRATDLVSDGPTFEAIYLRDMVAGETSLVSRLPGGAPARGSRPFMSADANHVVFNSPDPLVAEDSNGRSDVYVWFRDTEQTTRASVSSTGEQGKNDSLRGFITQDGRWVVFNSFASNLSAADKNPASDIYARDLINNETHLLTSGRMAAPADGPSFRPVPSGDGSVVAFLSRARNLVEPDESTGWQVYIVRPALSDGENEPPDPPAPDTEEPAVTISRPTPGESVSTTMPFVGEATDDRSVAAVYLLVRNRDTGEWLHTDGSWRGQSGRLSATLEGPVTSVSWTFSATLDPGNYGFLVRSIDEAGNKSAWTPFRVFAVQGTN